ncbi:MAG: hypothetical protein NWE92_04420 [Candidatus Bathyarchaeota archaeon]|nr:hypothetical protein [Candidatus Bathyarchaeota archaeon]
MRKKTLLILLTACIIAVIAVSLVLWSAANAFQIPRSYHRSIARNFDNTEEENALNKAEALNYTYISGRERFLNPSDPEEYQNSLSYTYANFIDADILNYYQTRYDNQQGKELPRQIGLTYQANATMYPQIRIYKPWNNNTVLMSTPDGEVLSKTFGYSHLFYKNQSSYTQIEREYDFNFSDCYVIVMDFSYSETYASLAAFISDVDQIVVLDQNFEPVLVGLTSSNAVA